LPIIKANNTLVDKDMTYIVKSEVTAIIDVSDAIDFVRDLRSQSERQREALKNVVSRYPTAARTSCLQGTDRPAARPVTGKEATSPALDAGLAQSFPKLNSAMGDPVAVIKRDLAQGLDQRSGQARRPP
jgi:hypothetical protein